MAAFTGLNSNIFYTGLKNGFHYVTTFADPFAGLNDELVSRFAKDGGEYGDQLVYTDMDILHSREWDPTASNVLETEQMVVPVQQAILIAEKRQIAMTVDNGYLSKRVWMAPGSWEGFKSVVVSQMANTKKVYDQRMIDTYVGNVVADMPSGKGAKQSQKVIIPALGADATFVETEAYQRLKAMKIGKKIADIFVDMADSTRDYNDYGFMRSYAKSDLLVIWNKDYINELDYISLPTIFHDQGITEFTGVSLPGRYFGRKVDTSTDCGSGKVIKVNGEVDATKGTVRSLVEKTFIFEGNTITLFPGDALASGVKVSYTGGSVSNPDFTQDEVYVEDSKVICKIVANESIVYPTSWRTGTEFFNARSLRSNLYDTWYYGKPDYRRSYPVVTLKESAS